MDALHSIAIRITTTHIFFQKYIKESGLTGSRNYKGTKMSKYLKVTHFEHIGLLSAISRDNFLSHVRQEKGQLHSTIFITLNK